ncbi:MAG: HD domain-containing protein [Firmicutes bacterium]|nr:HD domain-containing protein [Bacillota bacterium]
MLEMDIEAIKAWARSKMLEVDESPLEPGYRWYHGVRTAQLAIHLAKEMGLEVDIKVLELGGLLHDIGKAGYRGSEPHGPRGANIIRREIGHLFSPDKLEVVTAIVANHYQRPKSKYWRGKKAPNFPPEVLLVQDADILDHMGANAIWLAFHYGTAEGRNQAAAIQHFYQVDPPWYEECLASLNYEISRRELEHRLNFAHHFYQQWEREEGGKLTCLS